jgi:hypothetical protein
MGFLNTGYKRPIITPKGRTDSSKIGKLYWLPISGIRF